MCAHTDGSIAVDGFFHGQGVRRSLLLFLIGISDTKMSTSSPLEGVLELHTKGFGFLRSPAAQYLPRPGDPYVAEKLIQKFGLREGVQLAGPTENGTRGSGPRLTNVTTIEGMAPDKFPRRDFDSLTPIDPHEPFHLETGQEPLTTRIMDLLTPIGKGQRA